MTFQLLFSAKDHWEWPQQKRPSFGTPARVSIDRVLEGYSDSRGDWDEINEQAA